MARNFRELEAKMSPASRARSDAKTKKMIAEMALDELREARDLTQQHLASLLGINQAAVSKMEPTRQHVHQHTAFHDPRHGWEPEDRGRIPRGQSGNYAVSQAEESGSGRSVKRQLGQIAPAYFRPWCGLRFAGIEVRDALADLGLPSLQSDPELHPLRNAGVGEWGNEKPDSIGAGLFCSAAKQC